MGKPGLKPPFRPVFKTHIATTNGTKRFSEFSIITFHPIIMTYRTYTIWIHLDRCSQTPKVLTNKAYWPGGRSRPTCWAGTPSRSSSNYSPVMATQKKTTQAPGCGGKFYGRCTWMYLVKDMGKWCVIYISMYVYIYKYYNKQLLVDI